MLLRLTRIAISSFLQIESFRQRVRERVIIEAVISHANGGCVCAAATFISQLAHLITKVLFYPMPSNIFRACLVIELRGLVRKPVMKRVSKAVRYPKKLTGPTLIIFFRAP